MSEPLDYAAIRKQAEDLERMHEQTTQGEWFTYFSSSQGLWTIQVIRGWLFRQAGKCDTVGEKEAARFDAEHIAASHNARLSAVVLRLLDEIEHLRSDNANLSATIDEYL